MLSNTDRFQRFERVQFIAMGFLLGFERVTDADRKILTQLFISGRNVSVGSKTTTIDPYVEFQEDGCILKDGKTIHSYVPEAQTSVRTQLENIAGIDLIKYAQKLSVEEFVLRKIEIYGSVKEEELTDLFCKTQLEELQKTIKKGYVAVSWNDDIPHDDYLEVILSQKGLAQLFKLDYMKEIDKFIRTLKSLGYDETLLDDFLVTQNLSLSSSQILTVENFEQFCSTYDRAKEAPKHYTKK